MPAVSPSRRRSTISSRTMPNAAGPVAPVVDAGSTGTATRAQAAAQIAALGAPKCVFEQKAFGPTPSNTYYQVLVDMNNVVVLREWPRMRMSQKPSHHQTDPIQTRCSDFSGNKDFSNKIQFIFGQDTVEKIKAVL